MIERGITRKRVLEHLIFWLLALGVLTFYFGSDKSYYVALRNNLFYLPVHMMYYYFLAYVIIPRYLYKREYFRFGVFLVLCMLGAALLTRLVDILFVEPYLYRLQKELSMNFWWDKMEGTFTERLFRSMYFVNAVKGSNLIVWIALSIKFFKMWYERRQAAAEAELNYLKGQIHPHFLFNTLNNLYSLTLNQSAKASEVVLGLSTILRYMLYETNKSAIELNREIEIIRNYIELEKMRYDDSLEVNFHISGDLTDVRIAPLLLIPFVENAFKHGVSEKIGDAWINIELNLRDEQLKFKVSNSKPDVLPDDITVHKGNIGLTNVHKRLEILYPDAYSLHTHNEVDVFISVLEIRLDRRVTI